MTRVAPAEWSPHRAMWVGFPSHPELWEDDLAPAQAEAAELARALAGPGGERVRLLVNGEEAEAAARALLHDTAPSSGVEIVRGLFGDIWLRDTGPIYVKDGPTDVNAVGFRFNGWGGKYELEGDTEVAEQIAAASGTPLEARDVVLEGGAIDHDGLGAVLTTRQCLLNANRNGWSQEEAEAVLRDALGAKRVIWLEDGLLNDHTDGHIDNLARFVAPGVVALPVATGRDDPNAEIYEAAAAALSAASGPPLQTVRLASPGRVEAEGEPVPASHMNFVIANDAVVMPTYGPGNACQLALETLRSLFPERTVIGLPSRALLTGGGSFHCITQQEPVRWLE